MTLNRFVSIIKNGTVGSTAKRGSRTSEGPDCIIRRGERVVVCITFKSSAISGSTSASSRIVGAKAEATTSKRAASGRFSRVVEGCGSVFNLGKAVHSRRADAVLRKTISESLSEDWHKIGDDIRGAMSAHAQGKL